MSGVKVLALALAVLAAGCSASAQVRYGAPASGSFVVVEGAGGLAALLGLGFLTSNVSGSYGGYNPRDVPELDAERKVNEVDCTQPIDHTLGNIRCK